MAPDHHHNAIGISRGREPMGNDDHCSAATDRPHVVLHNALGLIIQGTGGLVEHQYPGVAHQRASDGDALPLAAREGRALFAHLGVIALGQLQDERVRPGELRRLDDASSGAPGSARAMLSRILRWNKRLSCSTTPICRRRNRNPPSPGPCRRCGCCLAGGYACME